VRNVRIRIRFRGFVLRVIRINNPNYSSTVPSIRNPYTFTTVVYGSPHNRGSLRSKMPRDAETRVKSSRSVPRGRRDFEIPGRIDRYQTYDRDNTVGDVASLSLYGGYRTDRRCRYHTTTTNIRLYRFDCNVRA